MDLFFDLDGTLTDPGVGIIRCIQHALTAMGHAPPPLEQLRQFVGPPLRATFAELLGTTDESVLDSAIQHYRERFVAIEAKRGTGWILGIQKLEKVACPLYLPLSPPNS